MELKKFVLDKIQYFETHFRRKAILLEENGQTLFQINLSFDQIIKQYMTKMQQLYNSQNIMSQIEMKTQFLSEGLYKITDQNLKCLWQSLDSSYKLSFNIERQNLTDDTVIRISQLYHHGKCGFTKLNFSGNDKISQIGAVKLADSLKNNKQIQSINFHGLVLGKHGANRISQLIVCTQIKDLDLGLVGDQSLTYLAKILENPHKLNYISFGEDKSDPWKKGKDVFQQIIRRGEYSKQIFSVNLYPEEPIKHWQLINQLNILCKKRRNLRLTQRQNQYKVSSLNPNHPNYYDPQNHSINAYKFSVKSYLTNVFGSDLDQALYFLQKQRRNSLRQEAIFKITREPINKIIMQDICTSDGSIIVLAKYLLGKIRQKKQKKEQF